MWGLSLFELIGLGTIALLGTGAALYLNFFRGAAVSRRLLAAPSVALSLREATMATSIWAPYREVFGRIPVPPPCAQGELSGIRYELRYEPCENLVESESQTSVLVLWPKKVLPLTGLDRLAAMDDPPAAVTKMLGAFADKRVEDPLFGRCAVWGTDADRDRLFHPAVRAKLGAFPRRISMLFVQDEALVMKWFGLEKDPGVILEAVRLCVDTLDAIAPR